MAKMKKKKGLSTAEIIQIEEAVKSGKGIGGLAVASKLLGKGIGRPAPVTKPSIYTIFDPENDVLENMKEAVSSVLWSESTSSLTAYYTSSTQSASSGDYYRDVYKKDPADSTAQVQFGIAYGHYAGSGSKASSGDNASTKAVYSQFRNILLTPNDKKFTMAGNVDADDCYFITINRSRIREKVDPGNWELQLSSSLGAAVGAGHTVGHVPKLIDDSGATLDPSVNKGGRVFNIVSGSIASGQAEINTAAASQPGGGLGLFYPDLGIFVLSAAQLDASASMGTERTVTGAEDNVKKFFQGLQGGAKFQARREENISSTHYFCRVRNKRYNFSANPTFFTQSDGSLTIPSFHKDPKVYITTVGLYNDENELLAVAKLSKPLLKSYAREAIIKVKLDF